MEDHGGQDRMLLSGFEVSLLEYGRPSWELPHCKYFLKLPKGLSFFPVFNDRKVSS